MVAGLHGLFAVRRLHAELILLAERDARALKRTAVAFRRNAVGLGLAVRRDRHVDVACDADAHAVFQRRIRSRRNGVRFAERDARALERVGDRAAELVDHAALAVRLNENAVGARHGSRGVTVERRVPRRLRHIARAERNAALRHRILQRRPLRDNDHCGLAVRLYGDAHRALHREQTVVPVEFIRIDIRNGRHALRLGAGEDLFRIPAEHAERIGVPVVPHGDLHRIGHNGDHRTDADHHNQHGDEQDVGDPPALRFSRMAHKSTPFVNRKPFFGRAACAAFRRLHCLSRALPGTPSEIHCRV